MTAGQVLAIFVIDRALEWVAGFSLYFLDEDPETFRIATNVWYVVLGVAPFAIVAAVLRGVSWHELGWRPAPRRWYGAALLAVLVYWVGSGIVNALLPEMGEPAAETLSQFGGRSILEVLVITAVAGPLAEELLFRGVLYRWLRDRWGVVAAVVLSSATFALAHDDRASIGLFGFGVLMALLYERSGSLYVAVFAHVVTNVLLVLIYAL